MVWGYGVEGCEEEMRLVDVTKSEWDRWPFSNRMFLDADIAIVDGVVVKNRGGKPGAFVGGLLVVWDEEEYNGEEFRDTV